MSNRRVLIDFPQKTEGNIIGGSFQPDGMIFDAAGRLYVAMFEGGVINVVAVPSGKLLRQYDAGGKQSTNCLGDDRRPRRCARSVGGASREDARPGENGSAS